MIQTVHTLFGSMSSSTTASQTEFVAEESETGVTEEPSTRLAPATEEIVRSLRHAIDDDDLIEELLWNRLRYCEKPIPLNGVFLNSSSRTTQSLLNDQWTTCIRRS